MTFIADLLDPIACERDLAGGKGANLARMAQASFPVPRAFIVTTAAYTAVFTDDFESDVAELLGTIDFNDADSVENGSRRIRERVTAVELPEKIAREIEHAYAQLGTGRYVAVRSSGTAEDMAEASFAGQHDTYLDIAGPANVLNAIKRCWGSLWTARAVAYRHAAGIGSKVSLAVVVQEMVDADIAGVLFTANPLTSATDEIVINAAWGLGEGVVSGVLTPDQISVHKHTRRQISAIPGSKEVRIVRNPDTGQGTVELPTDEAQRRALCLSSTQVLELTALGLEVERHYEGMPLDIEWAFASGTFYLLQARDITGVEFTWDEDVDAWQSTSDDPEIIWTRAFADEFWTGAITPLFYSVRAREHTASYHRCARLWGIPALAESRIFRYRDAEAYLSTRSHTLQIERILPRLFRTGSALDYLPPSMRSEVAQAPFSILGYLRLHARIFFLDRKQSVRGWITTIRDDMTHRVAEADGLSEEELRNLSDADLQRYTDTRLQFMEDLFASMWTGFQIHGAGALYLLGALLQRWYDGDNQMVYADLITGLPQRTLTLEENLALWDLAAEIRRDDELLRLFHASDEKSFFVQLREHPAGVTAAKMYRRLVEHHGHRGHADRDFYYPRRAEDAAIDYRSLKALLNSSGDRPDRMEIRLIAQREAAVADVIQRLRCKRLGTIRVAAFKLLHNYALEFLILRDDERHYIDRVTFAKKRAFREMGRRLRERRILTSEDDFHFLTREEIYESLEGHAPVRLLAAKISGRRRQFDRFHSKEYLPPLYLRGREVYHDVHEAPVSNLDSDLLSGMPTSRGCVTGRARVIQDLAHIGILEPGDILVTNSTDPGWTPVFSLIGGLVLETGGMLAHGACLSREYNLPAITIPNASKLIADGSCVTLDGNIGQLRIAENPAVAATG